MSSPIRPSSFRGQTTAATLKREGVLQRNERRLLFRGHTIAATLKQPERPTTNAEAWIFRGRKGESYPAAESRQGKEASTEPRWILRRLA